MKNGFGAQIVRRFIRFKSGRKIGTVALDVIYLVKVKSSGGGMK